jgi:hypothetical protein
MKTTQETDQRRSSIPTAHPQGIVLQRKCACGGSAGINTECKECNSRQLSLQRYSTGRVAPQSLAGSVPGPESSSPPNPHNGTPESLGHNFGHVGLHARTVTPRTQPKSTAMHSGDQLEQADNIARQLTHTLDAGAGYQVSVQSSAASPSIQRFPDDRPEAKAEAAPPSASSDAAAAPAASTSPQAAARSFIVEDDAREVGPGQMRKSEFLDQMEGKVCAAADEELAAVGHTAQGCPYVRNWLQFYRNRSSQHVERALRHYAPEAAGASNARDYIPFVTARVRRSAAIWATTGRITGLPPELAGQLPGAGLLGAVGGMLSGAAGMLTGMFGGIGRAFGGIFTKAEDAGAASPSGDPAQIQAQLGPGQSMDSGVRSRMEPAFGHDFSRVRIHSDSHAADLSAGLNARAFTIGSDIAFAAGDYQPETPAGEALLAHELAHVVQQGAANTQSATMAASTDALEREADESAERVVLSQWELSAEGGVAEPVLRKATHAGDQGRRPGPRGGLRLQRCGNDQPAAKVPHTKKPVEKPGEKAEEKEEKKEEKPKAPELDAMDNAAIGGLKQIFCKTQKTGLEWCGHIFRTADGGYRITGPGQGDQTFCGRNDDVKQGERLVAYYHSHPEGQGLDFSNAGESFGIMQGSQTGTKDIQEADARGITYYLINSDGEMKRYSPPSEKGTGGGQRKSLGKIDSKC